MEETLSAVRLCMALALMSAASAMDLRTRKVPNRVWILMGAAGMALLAAQMLLSGPTYRPAHYLVFVPIGIIFFDTFWDREPIYWEGKVNQAPVLLCAIAALLTAAMLVLEGVNSVTGGLLAVPVLMLVFVFFYYAGIIRGGADAKALMALALVFPFYPSLAGFPLLAYPEPGARMIQMTFPFAFLVLMNAAILHAVSGPLIRLFRNLVRRDIAFPEMFLGYRMDLKEVPKNFVWPMEAVRDDEVVLILFPRKDGKLREELLKLRAKGLERIWVTPKDPFIVPMTVAILISALIGNFMVLLF